MILVWCADSGAYFVGRAIGKHKMSPNVSPNKTIEGLLGGVVCSLIAFVILGYKIATMVPTIKLVSTDINI